MAVMSRKVRAGEQLGHRRQRRQRPTARSGPRRFVHQLLGTVEVGDGVRQVVGQRLERTERLVELWRSLAYWW
jgi:hypothetical protein